MKKVDKVLEHLGRLCEGIVFSDIKKADAFLPKGNYTIDDVKKVQKDSYDGKYKKLSDKMKDPRGFNDVEAAFIVKASAAFHDTDYDAKIDKIGKSIKIGKA